MAILGKPQCGHESLFCINLQDLVLNKGLDNGFKPLLSCFETNILFSLSICIMALYMIIFRSGARRRQIHQNVIYTEVIVEYVVGIAIPLYVLMRKKTIRIYFWNHLQNLFS